MKIIESNLSFGSLSKRKSTKRLILHNSGVTVLQSVETIHNYHKNKGWAGIGYHFYIRKDGNIYAGRPEDTIGAHAYGSNNDSIGICFEGNFNEETMNDVQKNAGQELVAYLKNKYSINIVQKHSDVCSTSCPGKNFPFNEIINGKLEDTVVSNGYSVGRYEVTANVLTVRTGAGTENDWLRYSQLTPNAQKQIYEKAGYKPNGLVKGVICDVSQISGNWGKIPSGWICLDYCKKI